MTGTARPTGPAKRTGPAQPTGVTGTSDRSDATGATGATSTVLVINAGSSSVKYELIEPTAAVTLASGLVERVGGHDTVLHHRNPTGNTNTELGSTDHRGAIEAMIDAFSTHGPDLASTGVTAVGHRVVMGGSDIHLPTLIDDALVDRIDELAPLAPLHNPANAAAIRMARSLLPSVPHVAVFDTAFFHDLPDTSARYAIDPEFAAERAIRRYGFHGISHEYVSRVVAGVISHDADQPFRQIVLHLGNGASASAVVDGRPVDTSMGFTPLEGLVMGTRSGDIDPSVAFYLVRHHGMSIDEVDHLLNYDSGMAAMAGSNDMRDVHALIAAGADADAGGTGGTGGTSTAVDTADTADTADAGAVTAAAAAARTALEIYVHRLRRYIGAYAAVMGGLDAVTFTAGVGENDRVVREMATRGLEFMGIELDAERNADPTSFPASTTAAGHTSRATGTEIPAMESDEAMVISTDDSRVAVLVVATNEELSIAQQTHTVVALHR